MSVADFYRKTVSTKRLTTVGGGSYRRSMTEVEASVPCAIHPLSSEEAVVLGSAFYQAFKMFCASTYDIEIGDKVIDGSTEYQVQGKTLYDDVGGSANEHMRLILVKGK